MIDLDLLLSLGAVYKSFSRGEVIFMEGNHSNFYYQLVSGKINWLNINDEGKEYLQSVIEPGESFGELSLFDDEPHVATAIAQEDSVIVKLCKSTFKQLLSDHPEIYMAFSKLLSQRLRFKFFLLRELYNNHPEERISSLITYLKDTNHNICPSCGKIKLTRQQIANMTCLRVETVIRAMRHMHERGEITINKGKAYCGNMTRIISRKCVS